MQRVIHGEKIIGIDIDAKTRCSHYHSALDIIAIKFKCCGGWFPCFQCHSEIAEHNAQIWPLKERNIQVILCGACGRQLSITDYLGCNSTCPACKSGFNPGCASHYHLYFA